MQTSQTRTFPHSPMFVSIHHYRLVFLLHPIWMVIKYRYILVKLAVAFFASPVTSPSFSENSTKWRPKSSKVFHSSAVSNQMTPQFQGKKLHQIEQGDPGIPTMTTKSLDEPAFSAWDLLLIFKSKQTPKRSWKEVRSNCSDKDPNDIVPQPLSKDWPKCIRNGW